MTDRHGKLMDGVVMRDVEDVTDVFSLAKARCLPIFLLFYFCV
jgi:hypothetical protein